MNKVYLMTDIEEQPDTEELYLIIDNLKKELKDAQITKAKIEIKYNNIIDKIISKHLSTEQQIIKNIFNPTELWKK